MQPVRGLLCRLHLIQVSLVLAHAVDLTSVPLQIGAPMRTP